MQTIETNNPPHPQKHPTTNIPPLRFPGFVGEWVEKKLGQVTSKIGSGKTPKGGDKVYQNEGIPFIRSQNVIDDNLVLDDTHIPDEVHYEMRGSKVLSNDILLNITGGSIGRSCVVPSNFLEGNVNQHVCIIRLLSFDSKFLQSILSSHKGQKLIFQGQTGSGREGLNFQSIRGFKIHFPTLPEQKKIATFLTAVDRRIQLLTQKKAKLEQYKKGVMQGLFAAPQPSGLGGEGLADDRVTANQNPEIHPSKKSKSRQLRFKDENGDDFPDWEERKLGEVATNVSYGIASAATAYDGINKYLRITDIDENSNKFFPNPLSSPTGKINKRYYLKTNDIVFARTGASVGKSYLYNEKDGNLVYAGFLIKFSIKKADARFVFYYTQTYEYKKWTAVMSQRSGQPGINAEEYKSLPFNFPSLPEQKKIATFLSSIDAKIEKVGVQIEKMQAWKKGLLQQMFV